ncbi:MAG: 30S ribosomal protein S11, partial [Verrucomicrobiae bacterium]|nr:30S ribosomal protein S11 [Verrucomicrobiae bacterium]
MADETENPQAEAAPAAAAPAAPAVEEKKPEVKKERTAEDIFLELEGGEAAEKPKLLKAKGSKNVHAGVVHVSATFNNTIVSVSDLNGNIIGWSSAGKMGFRGSRKSTAYAAQLVSQDACRQAMSHGLRQAEVRVKGPGAGRESAVRAVQALGIDVTRVSDVTPM